MKLNLIIYQVFVFICFLNTTQLVRPRRLYENLGRIHDAIHELTEELPENDHPPFRRGRPNRFA